VRQGISADMRQSANQTEKNQVSQATQRQDQVNHKLDELLDILSNRREHELGQLVKKLREAEKQLSELREPSGRLAQENGCRRQDCRS